MKNLSCARNSLHILRSCGVLLLLILIVPVSAGQLAKLTIKPENSDGESSFVLSWDSTPDFVYRVQKSTDLGNNQNWLFDDAIVADSSVSRWEVQVGSSNAFYRLAAQPEIFGLEPTWVDSSDSNAVLYLLGQGLPTNATVVINGMQFTATIINTGGVYCAVSLNGLPPGELKGIVSVIDNDTGNVVATYKLQAGFIYATQPPPPQLVGPPREPPASPTAAFGKKIYVGNLPFSATSKAFAGKKGLNAVNVSLAARTVRRAGMLDDSGMARSTGEFRSEETDLAIPGRGIDFLWTRTYGSRTGLDTAQGRGWDFSYNVSLTQQSDGTVQVCMGNGRCDTFYPNGTNGWSRDEYFLEVRDLDGDSMPDVLFADGGKWLFKPFDPTDPASGKLGSSVDRNGNAMRFEYNGVGGLIHVVDTLDRTNTVSYNTSGQIESVTDFSGRTVRYEYDSSGNLAACISPAVVGTPTKNDFPGGKTNRYTYSGGFSDERLNHNLTSCIDAKGQAWLRVFYQSSTDPDSLDFDAVAFTLRGVDKKDIWRGRVTPSPSNGFAVTRVIENDYAGNVTESFYDSRQRCVRELEFTGRADPALETTHTLNRPAGKLRVDDPDFYETLWKWNSDSLCTLETLPNGGRTRLVYERDFNPGVSPRKKGDLRVLRELSCCLDMDSDDDGIPDATERVWRYEYDPRFGSPTRLNHPASCSTREKREGSFADGVISGGFKEITGIATSADYASKIPASCGGHSGHSGDYIAVDDGFIASATDPRGNQTTADYDEHGNRLRLKSTVQLPNLPTSDFAYNSSGQLTVITNVADANGYRRVDKFDYYTNGPQAGYCRTFTVDAQGPVVTLTTLGYDERGNVTRCIDPRGNDTLYTFNALDQCVRSLSPVNLTARSATDYFYDANDNLVQTKVELRDEKDVKLGDISTFCEYDIFDCPIRVTEQIDATRNAVTDFAYDSNRQLSLIRSPEAVNGNDPHNVTQFVYDERGLLFRETSAPSSANQSTTQYDYNADGNLTRVSEGLEETPQVTTMEYDGFAGFGSGSNQKKVLGTFTLIGCGLKKFNWGPQLEGGKEIEKLILDWDWRRRHFSPPQIAAGSIQGLRSEALALRAKEDSMAGRSKQSEVKANMKAAYTSDRVSRITDSLGNVTTFAYDSVDNLKLVRHFGETNDVPGSAGNLRLAETRYDYDKLNRCTGSHRSFFDPLTQKPIGNGISLTSFAYAPNGSLTSVTDGNGNSTSYGYDTAAQLISVTSAGSKSVFLAVRDEAGNVTRITQTDHSDLGTPDQVFESFFSYDSLDRCVAGWDNVGNTNRSAFDSRGNLVIATDARGNDTCYKYDGLNRCTESISYVGPCDASGITISTSHVEYDSNSRCVASTDSNGNVTQYSYDSRNRVVLFGGMDGTSRNLVWSPRSNLIREQDSNGTVITNVYDLLDRCVRRDITPAPGVATTTTFETFEYNGRSHLVHASNNVSCALFTYDSLGNKIKATQDCIAAAQRTFDSVGNCLSITYRGGTVVNYTYNALDEVTSVSRSVGGLPAVTLATFAYEGPGRIGRISRNNGVNTHITWNGTISPANATGDFGWQQVSSVNHQVAGGGAVIDRRGYSYDRNQNKTLRAQLTPFPGDVGMTTNIFDYDALDRLRLAIKTKGTSAQRNDYSLDGNGNRVNVLVMDNGATQLQEYTMAATVPNPADFQMNQYTATPFGTLQYDNNGNLAARNSTASQVQYVYDYADRLVSVGQLGGSGLMEPLVSFTYDALGRRISKTTYPPAPLTPVTTEFIHGEICDDHIEEYENGVLKEVFVHVTGLKEEIRENDSVLVSFTGTGQPHYYHSDELGNVLALTGATPGDVLERYDYDDYGAPHFLAPDGSPLTGSDGLEVKSSLAGNPFLFHGMEWDSEMDLYFQAWPCRWKAPELNASSDTHKQSPYFSAGDKVRICHRQSASYFDPAIGRTTTSETRQMTVNEARPMEPRMAGGGGMWNSASSKWQAQNLKYVGGGGKAQGIMGHSRMKTGTVKFFNDAKGFGRMMKEEGGRHTPFHNK